MTSAETVLGLENKRDSSDATDRSTVMVRLGTQVVLCAARMMMIEEENIIAAAAAAALDETGKEKKQKNFTPE